MLCFRSGLGLRLGLEPLLPEPPVPSPSSHPSLFRNTCQESEPIAAVSLTDGWCPNLTNYRLSVGTILHTRYSSAQRRAAGSSERYYFLGGRIYRTRSYNSSKLPKLTARCPRLTTPASPRAWRRSQEFLSRPPSPNNKPFALSALYGRGGMAPLLSPSSSIPPFLPSLLLPPVLKHSSKSRVLRCACGRSLPVCRRWRWAAVLPPSFPPPSSPPPSSQHPSLPRELDAPCLLRRRAG